MTILEISHLSKSFGGIHALTDVSLSLLRGKISGIIGPNGAGKTTLFNLITGYLKPDTGRITYASRIEITGLTPPRIAKIGIIRGFQNVRLFENLTVLDNVMIYLDQHRSENPFFALLPQNLSNKDYERNKSKAFEVLEKMGLDKKAEILARDLSYAEQKLLNLSRLFSMSGELVLLDEPMSGVDSKVVEKITRFIKELPQLGKTVCIIEHSLEVIESVSDEVIFIGEGQVLFQGDIKQVFENNKLADLYLGV